MRSDFPYSTGASQLRRQSRRSCGCAFAITILIVACVGVVVIGGIFVESGVALPEFVPEFLENINQSSRSVTAPVVAHFMEEDGESAGFALVNEPPGIRIESNDSVNTTDVPIYLGLYDRDINGTALRWEAEIDHEENPGDLKPVNLNSDETRLFASIGSELVAFDLADGHEHWRISLSDIVPPNCDGCIVVAEGRVIVMSLDKVVEAFDVENGQSLWQYTLRDDSPPSTFGERIAMTIADSRLITLDRNEDNISILLAIGLADGAMDFEISPECNIGERQRLFRSGPAIIDESAAEIHFIFDSFASDPVCQQSWDLRSGTLNWENSWPAETELPFAANHGLMSTTTASDFYAADNAHFYFSAQADGASEPTQIIQISRFDGQHSLFTDNPADQILIPLYAADNQVIVQARSTRGSETDTLWAVDFATLDLVWQYELAEARRYGFDSGTGPSWDILVEQGSIYILETANSDGLFQLTELDLVDGNQIQQSTSSLDDRALGITKLYWTSSAAYLLVLGDLYEIQIAGSELDKIWP